MGTVLSDVLTSMHRPSVLCGGRYYPLDCPSYPTQISFLDLILPLPPPILSPEVAIVEFDRLSPMNYTPVLRPSSPEHLVSPSPSRSDQVLPFPQLEEPFPSPLLSIRHLVLNDPTFPSLDESARVLFRLTSLHNL